MGKFKYLVRFKIVWVSESWCIFRVHHVIASLAFNSHFPAFTPASAPGVMYVKDKSLRLIMVVANCSDLMINLIICTFTGKNNSAWVESNYILISRKSKCCWSLLIKMLLQLFRSWNLLVACGFKACNVFRVVCSSWIVFASAIWLSVWILIFSDHSICIQVRKKGNSVTTIASKAIFLTIYTMLFRSVNVLTGVNMMITFNNTITCESPAGSTISLIPDCTEVRT